MKSQELIKIIDDKEIKSKLMVAFQKDKDADLFAILKSELEDQVNYDGDILGWFKDKGYYSSIESIEYSKDKKYKTETYMLRKDGFVPREKTMRYYLTTSSVAISGLPKDAQRISQNKNRSNSRLSNPTNTYSEYESEQAIISSLHTRGLSAQDGAYESTNYNLELRGQNPVYKLDFSSLKEASFDECFAKFCDILKSTDNPEVMKSFSYFIEDIDDLRLSEDKEFIIYGGSKASLVSFLRGLNELIPFYNGDFEKLTK